MSITSLVFAIFFIVALILYYIFPKKQKYVILTISLLFIASYDIRGIIFILLTSYSVWIASQKIEKNKKDNKEKKLNSKRIIFTTLFINIGILVLLKYILPQINFFTNIKGSFSLLIPLGISYYTLQAISYLLDVYWNRIEAEKSFLKVLIFICYFPQMLQGPISRYKYLSYELYKKENKFDIKNIKYGIQLIIWGYFQVKLISPRLGDIVEQIFYGETIAYGLTVIIGLIAFGFQLYTNFSGGIDMVRGISECFGIILPQNFRQPFFSKSLGEFWRRWHITLGTWMKDYVFYPISMSKFNKKAKKYLKKHVSRSMANRIVIASSNVVVFLLVGIWHGTGTNYALWGLYNGLILAFSEIMFDYFEKTKNKLHINCKNKIWSIFCYIRTFIIVTIGWCTDCANTSVGTLNIFKNMLMINKTNLYIINSSLYNISLILIFLAILFIIEIIHEKQYQVRDIVSNKNIVFQMTFWTIIIQLIIVLAPTISTGGLMYANF